MKQINLIHTSSKGSEDHFWSKTIWLLVIICGLFLILLSVRFISVAKGNNLRRKIHILERQLLVSNSRCQSIKKWKKDIINYRKKIARLRSLFQENFQIQSFFHELSKMALKKGYFTEIDKKKDFLRIKGVVWQQREITALYSKMIKIDSFREAHIVSIETNEKSKDNKGASNFIIEGKIKDKK